MNTLQQSRIPFRRSNDEGWGIDYIFGIKDNEEGAELQSIRFRLTQYSDLRL